MTKARAMRVARQARQHGHYQPSATSAYVRCPLCRDKVSAEFLAWEKPFKALDAAMVAHLTDGDCAEAKAA